jgi:hypothetical protein
LGFAFGTFDFVLGFGFVVVFFLFFSFCLAGCWRVWSATGGDGMRDRVARCGLGMRVCHIWSGVAVVMMTVPLLGADRWWW